MLNRSWVSTSSRATGVRAESYRKTCALPTTFRLPVAYSLLVR